jgi:hypothetical protein
MVLSKATEYIGYLEDRKKRLEDENIALMSQVNAFEFLLDSEIDGRKISKVAK